MERLEERMFHRRNFIGRAAEAAYSAFYPMIEHQTAPLLFRRLVSIRADSPGAQYDRAAIERCGIFRRTAPRLTIKGAGHFLQKDAGEKIAALIARWLQTGSAV